MKDDNTGWDSGASGWDRRTRSDLQCERGRSRKRKRENNQTNWFRKSFGVKRRGAAATSTRKQFMLLMNE